MDGLFFWCCCCPEAFEADSVMAPTPLSNERQNPLVTEQSAPEDGAQWRFTGELVDGAVKQEMVSAGEDQGDCDDL